MELAFKKFILIFTVFNMGTGSEEKTNKHPCPPGQLLHLDKTTEETTCCIPVYCDHDHFVQSCSVNGTQDLCVNCSAGTTLSYKSDSFRPKTCYTEPACAKIPEMTAITTKKCECNRENGLYSIPPENSPPPGLEQSIGTQCQPLKETCGKGRQPVNGKCVDCPPGFFKNDTSAYGLCRQQQNCTKLGLKMKTPCTTSTNAVCDGGDDGEVTHSGEETPLPTRAGGTPSSTHTVKTTPKQGESKEKGKNALAGWIGGGVFICVAVIIAIVAFVKRRKIKEMYQHLRNKSNNTSNDNTESIPFIEHTSLNISNGGPTTADTSLGNGHVSVPIGLGETDLLLNSPAAESGSSVDNTEFDSAVVRSSVSSQKPVTTQNRGNTSQKEVMAHNQENTSRKHVMTQSNENTSQKEVVAHNQENTSRKHVMAQSNENTSQKEVVAHNQENTSQKHVMAQSNENTSQKEVVTQSSPSTSRKQVHAHSSDDISQNQAMTQSPDNTSRKQVGAQSSDDTSQNQAMTQSPDNSSQNNVMSESPDETSQKEVVTQSSEATEPPKSDDGCQNSSKKKQMIAKPQENHISDITDPDETERKCLISSNNNDSGIGHDNQNGACNGGANYNTRNETNNNTHTDQKKTANGKPLPQRAISGDDTDKPVGVVRPILSQNSTASQEDRAEPLPTPTDDMITQPAFIRPELDTDINNIRNIQFPTLHSDSHQSNQ